jgi:hypothetical protein
MNGSDPLGLSAWDVDDMPTTGSGVCSCCGQGIDATGSCYCCSDGTKGEQSDPEPPQSDPVPPITEPPQSDAPGTDVPTTEAPGSGPAGVKGNDPEMPLLPPDDLLDWIMNSPWANQTVGGMPPGYTPPAAPGTREFLDQQLDSWFHAGGSAEPLRQLATDNRPWYSRLADKAIGYAAETVIFAAESVAVADFVGLSFARQGNNYVRVLDKTGRWGFRVDKPHVGHGGQGIHWHFWRW